jgi:hypothetical protein
MLAFQIQCSQYQHKTWFVGECKNNTISCFHTKDSWSFDKVMKIVFKVVREKELNMLNLDFQNKVKFLRQKIQKH